MPVQMELSRILISETRDYQQIELKEIDGERRFSIVIGIFEAAAIERRLKGIIIRRPQTHDLLANIILAMGGVLESILINDVSDDTFYAQLNILREDEMVEVDCRPSDAIALGIANQTDIFVAEHVLDIASKQQL